MERKAFASFLLLTAETPFARILVGLYLGYVLLA